MVCFESRGWEIGNFRTPPVVLVLRQTKYEGFIEGIVTDESLCPCLRRPTCGGEVVVDTVGGTVAQWLDMKTILYSSR